MTHEASDAAKLLERATALAGRSIDDLARSFAAPVSALGGVHGKGRLGELVERALCASGGSGRRVVDFPEYGVELKTIPVDEHLRPSESTFVAAIDLSVEVDWDDSWVKKKLARVLFMPIIHSPTTTRRFGTPVLWSPTPEQEAVLRGDYDDVMGLVGIGRVEDVTGHLGRYLQVRPKARDGSARTIAHGREGERIATIPRGFYLRSKFTGAILADPAALPAC